MVSGDGDVDTDEGVDAGGGVDDVEGAGVDGGIDDDVDAGRGRAAGTVTVATARALAGT